MTTHEYVLTCQIIEYSYDYFLGLLSGDGHLMRLMNSYILNSCEGLNREIKSIIHEVAFQSKNSGLNTWQKGVINMALGKLSLSKYQTEISPLTYDIRDVLTSVKEFDHDDYQDFKLEDIKEFHADILTPEIWESLNRLVAKVGEDEIKRAIADAKTQESRFQSLNSWLFARLDSSDDCGIMARLLLVHDYLLVSLASL